ncbi:MAG: nicotinate phosphoribosyltransferase [Rhizobiales bacterium]|nr:nicotinate phosphoribosyltransferase [Hyphomicrobiales bacterium]MBI3672694.1 nicotinate phosphoribosyltransferase [Hyphomicrobiales bacterium]
MMQAYLSEGLTGEAVFSLFVRRLPGARNYLIACGLDTLLDFLAAARFSPDDISYLASLSLFAPDFLDWLRGFRFTGTVYAVAEGTLVFANEPIVEIVAPLPQAQLFETIVMNQIHLQTLLASKAARMVSAAQGRRVVDFGARRMHGTDAGIKAARAFHIAGIAATSNLAAGHSYGIPVAGTMGHSYIQAHESEAAAFRAFARIYPDTVLLIDTYDTLAAARTVIDLAKRHVDEFRISAVRLDSGDLGILAREVRSLLDAAGLQRVQIMASGGLDEAAIERLVGGGAPIDSFGIGTSMGVSADMPGLDIAYKLTEYGGKGRLKLSTGKAILPGRKQVFRREEGGRLAGDEIARFTEQRPGVPLLACVMRNGRKLAHPAEPLSAMRERARDGMARLPESILSLAPADPSYPVAISAALSSYGLRVRREIARKQQTEAG